MNEGRKYLILELDGHVVQAHDENPGAVKGTWTVRSYVPEAALGTLRDDNWKLAMAVRYVLRDHRDNCPCYACSTERRYRSEPKPPAGLSPSDEG